MNYAKQKNKYAQANAAKEEFVNKIRLAFTHKLLALIINAKKINIGIPQQANAIHVICKIILNMENQMVQDNASNAHQIAIFVLHNIFVLNAKTVIIGTIMEIVNLIAFQQLDLQMV